MLSELQGRIENFEAGPALTDLARKIVAADPGFAMGAYYLSAVPPTPDEGPKLLSRAVELSAKASEGERRFIEAMSVARANNGANLQAGVPLLEKLAADYPGERLVQVILGQVYQGVNQPDKATAAFERAGRLLHGRCRVLARMGKHEEAWAEAETVRETVRKMIEEGGEPAKQYWPAYHYLAGYLKMEAGNWTEAKKHLEQADPNDPFHSLLRGRVYEKLGDKAAARKAFQSVVDSQANGIERALALPEARRKLAAL
jgi:tetratricopeptide (TPR) repeat protein